MSIGDQSHRVYRFGHFSLDLDRETLFQGTCEIHLRPKSFSVLRLLLESRGRLVTKAELHDAAWGKAVVTDDTLAHCIADIRRVLGAGGSDMLRTVPRRGYIFDPPPGQAETVTPVMAGRQGRFSGRHLSFAAPVGLLAVTVWLWSATGADRDVNSERPVSVVPQSAVDNPESLTGTSDTAARAYQEYLKGQFFHDRRALGDIDRAEASYKAAIELDPTLGPAWTGLAGIYVLRQADSGSNDVALLQALGDAAHRGVALAPSSADAHIRMAKYYFDAGKPEVAGEYFERAVALEPDNALVLGVRAGLLAHQGHLDDAIELQVRAIDAAPLSATMRHNLAWYLLAAGRIEEAAVQIEEFSALNPSAIGSINELLGDLLLLQGNYDEALTVVRGRKNVTRRESGLAMIYHALGQESQSAAALSKLLAGDGEDVAVRVAEVYAHRGNREEALRWLSEACSSDRTATLNAHQLFDRNLWLLSPYLIGLRDDARWKAMLAAVFESRKLPAPVSTASIDSELNSY